MTRARLLAGTLLRRLLPIFLAATPACARKQAAPPSSPVSALEGQPESLVARVARLRQLPERRPTPVIFDDDATFHAAADRKAEREAIRPTAVDLPAVQLGLGLIFAARGAARASSFGSLHRSQMVAFYDEFTHQVHVRARARDEADAPFVVAHELGHSLQFQHFRTPEVANVIDEDARLARLALLEGDAMLTMAAFAADENQLPLSRVLVRVAQGASEASLRDYRTSIEQSPELRSAPPFQRERLMFPYQAGASFVAQIHRAGGFSLVNRLYDAPPSSTEQILHPEKYLAGEPMVPVRAPEVPAGWQGLRSGHVGELLLGAMLDVCNERPIAREAAIGWGGDAFTVASRGEQGGLLLVTAWDTEADARQFERAMRVTADCWDHAPEATRAIFRNRTLVRRDGLVVSVARGFGAEVARRSLAGSAGLVSQRLPARPPFGAVSIPAVKQAFEVPKPFVRNGRLIAPRLGLSIPVTRALEPRIEEDDVSFRAAGAGFASLLFAISDLAYTERAVRQSFDTFERALQKPLEEGEKVSVLLKAGSVSTPLGTAVERVWQVEGSPVRGRLLLVPICAGTGMLVIAQGYADEATRALLDDIVTATRPLSGASPLCAELDP
ncbi:MAG: hypothetical protein EOO73_16685 [Myxococcales bacterium]|nr:MAG: hypothetical protein EOO73_16685 [Myxococcales bacterium]